MVDPCKCCGHGGNHWSRKRWEEGGDREKAGIAVTRARATLSDRESGSTRLIEARFLIRSRHAKAGPSRRRARVYVLCKPTILSSMYRPHRSRMCGTSGARRGSLSMYHCSWLRASGQMQASHLRVKLCSAQLSGQAKCDANHRVRIEKHMPGNYDTGHYHAE
jgi:hypothetical protein